MAIGAIGGAGIEGAVAPQAATTGGATGAAIGGATGIWPLGSQNTEGGPGTAVTGGGPLMIGGGAVITGGGPLTIGGGAAITGGGGASGTGGTAGGIDEKNGEA